MSEELSAAELTYLELTAKHAPQELPGSSALVLRLVQQLALVELQDSEVEALCDQVGDLQDQITSLQTEISRLEAEKKELQEENEDLQEQLDDASHMRELN